MRTKQKTESLTEEAPIVINWTNNEHVSQITEEASHKSLIDIEPSKKLKEKTGKFYINHI